MTFTRLRTGNFLSGSVASGTLGPGAITGFPAAASASDDDLVLIYDDDAAALRKMTRANFTSGITGDITAVTAGTGLTGGGDTGDVTLAINDSVVATISGSNFTGNVGVTGSIQSTLGYSGSLTNLLDGTSYLAAGAGITVSSSSNGQIVITNDGTVGDITSVVAGTGLSGGGSSGDVTLAINDSVVATISGSNFSGNVGVTGSLGATLGFSGSLTNLLDGASYLAAGPGISIASSSNGQIVITNDGTVGDITSVTAGTGLSGGGSTGGVTLSIDDSIVATVSGTNFTGNVGVTGSFAATTGISGSLTRLVGGESYLVAGPNVTIVSESNGSVTVSSTATATPGGSDTQVQFNDGGSFGGDAGLVFNKSTNSLHAQGVLTGALGLTGSLTRLVDGTSYLAAGSNITITSASNGQVTISAAGAAFTAGTGLILEETEFSINDSVVATLSGSKFSGDVAIGGNLYLSGNVSDFTATGSAAFKSGLSGSITRLVDGTSYLAAGANVTITSASNGQVSIASATGLTEISQDTSPELGGQLVTGDHKIAFGTGNNTSEIDFTYNGGGNFTAIASVKSIDMFLDLNGGDAGQQFRIFNNLQPASSYAGGTNTDVNAIFRVREEGNVFTKGYITSSMGFSGSLTRLTDGTSYLAAGSGISIASASNGQVVISNDGTVGDITSVTAGTGLSGGGTSGPVSLAIDDSVVATLTGSKFSGDVALDGNLYLSGNVSDFTATGSAAFKSGLSGSLTHLTDGTSYLAAGDNVTITSASNGQVTISAPSAGEMTSFTVVGDGDANPQTITDGNTLKILGSSGLDIQTTATDTVLAAVDYSGADSVILAATNGTGITVDVANDKLLIYDNDAATVKYINANQLATGDITSVTAGTGLTGGGDSGDVTLAIDDSVVATLTGSKFSGDVTFGGNLYLSGNVSNLTATGSAKFKAGLSGSLTRLVDGTSYLAAGSNVTITSASNGQVSIAAATGLTEISQDTSPELGGQLVTGDNKISFGTGDDTSEIDLKYNGSSSHVAIASIRSIDLFLDSNLNSAGTDNLRIFNDLEPASSHAAGTNTNANAIFRVHETGNVLAKGYVTASMGFSGSLTRLTDGTSYLAAGSNVTITSASNGQIVIAATDTDTEYTAGDGLDLSGTTFSTDLKSDGGLKIVSTELAIDDGIVATISGSNFKGNVGITGSLHVGSSAGSVPTTRALDVYANVSGDYAAHIDNDRSSQGHGLKVTSDGTGSGTNLFDVESASTTVFRVRGDGRVGIGKVTSLPSSVLTVSSSNSDSDLAIAHMIHHIGDDDTNIAFDTNKITLEAGGSKNLSIDSTDGVLVTGSVRSTLGYSGSLTNLLDGTSYLAAGSNITIASASNGQVTISSTGGGTPGGSDTQLQFNDGGSFGGISGVTTDGSVVTFGDSAILVGQDIAHAGDDNTKITFGEDAIGFTVGNEQLLTISEAGTDMVTVGDGGDVDFRVRTNNDDNTLYIVGSTDNVGIGLNNAATTLHLKDSDVAIRLQRENNSEASTIEFAGSGGNLGASIAHDNVGNDMVFDVFDGSGLEESIRLGGYGSGANRQVIILSGNTMHGGAMHPRKTPDIAFFVSGSIGSKNTAVKGAAVFGGDTVVSGGFFTSNTRVKSPTRHVLQSTGSIMSLATSMNFFSMANTADQSGILANTYELGVADGEYDGQEVTLMFTGSLLPSSGTYAVWSDFGSGEYVKQVRVGYPGAAASITLAFSTGTPSAINGKTLGLIDSSGALFSFTGSSSASPGSPSFDAANKSVTYGVSGISTTDDAASSLSNGVALAIFGGAKFDNPVLPAGGSGRITIGQGSPGSAGNTSITGTAIADGTIGDIGGTGAFTGGLNVPNAPNVNYTNAGLLGGAYINYLSPTLRMVWDGHSGMWNVLSRNDETF